MDRLAPLDVPEGAAGRIMLAARATLARGGYAGLTMDGLAHELGMSKKTIYQHFSGKEAIALAIATAVVETIWRRAQAVLAAPDLAFAARLRALIAVVADGLGWVSTDLLRDLERHAPAVYAELEALRDHNVERIFAPLLAEGARLGLVRPQVEPRVALAFWLRAVEGWMRPDNLARLGLDPRPAFEKAVDLFLRGLLTQAARDEPDGAG